MGKDSIRRVKIKQGETLSKMVLINNILALAKKAIAKLNLFSARLLSFFALYCLRLAAMTTSGDGSRQRRG